MMRLYRREGFRVSFSLQASLLGLTLSHVCMSHGYAQQCKKTAFGKGDETIVDETVRKTLDIDASRIKFKNQVDWDTALEGLVDKVGHTLDRNRKGELRAVLYKLLLYEEGGFFKGHRDTEKDDAHFATLVVQLPSRFDGGVINVHYQGWEETYDFGGPDSLMHSYFTAFFTDCIHEILPVTSGCRLALVYKLIDTGVLRTVVDPGPAVDRVTEALKGLQSRLAQEQEEGGLPKPSTLVHVLSHIYTPAGRRNFELKNLDRIQGEVLRTATQRAGWRLFVASCQLCEYAYDPEESTSCRVACGDHNGTPEAERWIAKNCKWEVKELWLDLTDVVDADTGEALGHPMYVEQDGVLGGIDGVEVLRGQPDEKEYNGYLGNESAQRIRRYSRSALIMWPPEEDTMHRVKSGDEKIYGLDALEARLRPGGEWDTQTPLPAGISSLEEWIAASARLLVWVRKPKHPYLNQHELEAQLRWLGEQGGVAAEPFRRLMDW